MNKFLQLLMATISTLVLLVFIACSSDDPTATEENVALTIAQVYPADGSINLSTFAKVSVAFTGPVDTISVMNNFHLAGGVSMHEWRDSLTHFGGWGMMGMNRQDQLTDWMDSIQIMGTFHWNDNQDSCEFIPNGQLYPNTNYLCLLDETKMRDHQGGMMGGMGHNNENGYHTFGFTTGN